MLFIDFSSVFIIPPAELDPGSLGWFKLVATSLLDTDVSAAERSTEINFGKNNSVQSPHLSLTDLQ